jgi:Ca2+-binding EF-hand superfamily protein
MTSIGRGAASPSTGGPVLLRWLGGAFAIVATLAPSDRTRAADEDVREIFGILDENGDGVVSREEFMRQKTIIFFRSINDLDQDQRLSPEEIDVAPEAFADADLDGDGKFSGSEFVQARFVQFDVIDGDGDQEITFDELREVIEQYRP